MKKKFLLLFAVIICNLSFAQIVCESTTQLSGTWIGKIEDHPMKFEIKENSPNSPIFSFTNFLNEKFIILKSDIVINEKNEFVINLKEAKFSSPNYEKCTFSSGVLTISEVSSQNMKVNLKSVAPNCFLRYDVIMNMPDIDNIKLTKEQ